MGFVQQARERRKLFREQGGSFDLANEGGRDFILVKYDGKTLKTIRVDEDMLMRLTECVNIISCFIKQLQTI